MYVCIYIFMHMYVPMHTFAYVCICLYVHIYMYIELRDGEFGMCAYKYIHRSPYVRMYVCLHI